MIEACHRQAWSVAVSSTSLFPESGRYGRRRLLTRAQARAYTSLRLNADLQPSHRHSGLSQSLEQTLAPRLILAAGPGERHRRELPERRDAGVRVLGEVSSQRQMRLIEAAGKRIGRRKQGLRAGAAWIGFRRGHERTHRL